MPLQKLQFRPGVNREGTTLANEGGWFESDKVRFRSGYPEKLGGWEQDGGTYNPVCDVGQTQIGGTTTAAQPPTGSNYWGVCRSMWSWNALQGSNFASLGTNLKYYIQKGVGGQFNDITPIRLTHPAIANAFTTFTGDSSRTVLVTDPGHGAVNGDFVVISAVSGSVNGITAAQLTKEFRIAYINSNQYNIVLPIGAATTAGPSAVSATFTYQINTGLDIYTVASGWGAGTWGGVVAGTATSTLATTLPGTTLSAQITNSATTINVVSTTGFESPSGSAWLGQELITYTGTTGTSLTGCTRGTGGTTAAVHFEGSSVVANITDIFLIDSASKPFAGLFPYEQVCSSCPYRVFNLLDCCSRRINVNSPLKHGCSNRPHLW